MLNEDDMPQELQDLRYTCISIGQRGKKDTARTFQEFEKKDNYMAVNDGHS